MRWIGICLWAESLAYLHLRQLGKSQETDRQALEIFRQAGDKEMESRAWDTLGLLAEANQDQTGAVEDYRRDHRDQH